MKKKLFPLIVVLIIIAIISIQILKTKKNQKKKPREPGMHPNVWFMQQRIYPKNEEISISMVNKVLSESKKMYNMKRIDNLVWEEMGPYNISGRITDIEGVNGNDDTLYMGSASGGVYKSVDGGYTWFPIFDENGILPIGDIAINPDSHNIVYIGTGESNASSQSYPGNGIYKSVNGGLTWENIGLDSTYYIGRIVISPSNPNIVYVAATGKLFSKCENRGIYRSLDDGLTWEKVLFISDSTSAIDIVINPSHPDTIFAAMWERIRPLDSRKSGGVTSGIYRSEDGGNTWNELTNGLPLSISKPGRIGLTIAKSNPSVIYAMYTDSLGQTDAVYRSADNGNSWTRKTMPDINSSYGWYFGNIRVSPFNENKIFVLGIYCYKSNNGGDTWNYVMPSAHVDYHAMYMSELDENLCFIGTDGGMNISNNGGNNISHTALLANMQFYQGCVDPINYLRLYGGSQDNGTNRTINGVVDNWDHILGGDGFFVSVDYQDTNIVYAEYQYGSLYRSDNFANNWSYIGSDFSIDRTNWSTPYMISPGNHNVLYLGTYRMYRSINQGDNWVPISTDLTFGGAGSSISTIDVSQADSSVIYSGTTDGRAWVSGNYGSTWSDISTGLPDRWITSITAHPYSPDTVIISFSGFRWDENAPHVMISGDRGNTWSDISGNLPDLPVNDVIFDANVSGRLYIANDAGVLYCNNYGQYYPLGSGIPPVPVTDIDLNTNQTYLYCFTYGRSAYRINIEGLGIANSKIKNNRENITINSYSSIFYNIPFIEFSSSKIYSGKIGILDIGGRVISEKYIGIKKGDNRFSLNVYNNLPAGVYYMYLKAGKVFKKLKVVKIVK